MSKKFLIVLSLFFIAVTASVKAAETYTITLIYDVGMGDVVGSVEYEAGELVSFDVTPAVGYEFHYWYWTSDSFVGPPQVQYTTPIEMTMPAYDIDIYVYFIDDITGYQQYTFEIGSENMLPLYPDLFKISLTPNHLFTVGRLSEAIILVEDIGGEFYEIYLMVGAPIAPFNTYTQPANKSSWVLTQMPDQDSFIELQFENKLVAPGVTVDKGDVIVKIGTTPLLVGQTVQIFLPLDDPKAIDIGGDKGASNVVAGLQTLLTFAGFWNDAGFLLIFGIIFILLIIGMVILKLSGMAIIIVSIAVIGVFAFMNILPFWAMLILLIIIVVYIFATLKGGKGESYE